MKRSDLYLRIENPGDDKLVVLYGSGETYISVSDRHGEASSVGLDDTSVRNLRDHLTLILETEQ